MPAVTPHLLRSLEKGGRQGGLFVLFANDMTSLSHLLRKLVKLVNIQMRFLLPLRQNTMTKLPSEASTSAQIKLHQLHTSWLSRSLNSCVVFVSFISFFAQLAQGWFYTTSEVSWFVLRPVSLAACLSTQRRERDRQLICPARSSYINWEQLNYSKAWTIENFIRELTQFDTSILSPVTSWHAV